MSQTVEGVSWGVVDVEAWRKIAVVSPHFDDAVQGACHVLTSYEDCSVITVYAGRPPAYPQVPTDWDASGGFSSGDDVVAIRREEDLEAMGVVGAHALWLENADHQYLDPVDRVTPEDVALDLANCIESLAPSAVFLPMGLANPDHVVTHEAGLIARRSLGDRSIDPVWFCYEDHGYKHIPGMLAWRVAKLFKAGLWPTPAIVPVEIDMDRKRRAIAAYRSQIPPLERDHALSQRLDANVPEQYWRIDPPPKGWERLSADLDGSELRMGS